MSDQTLPPNYMDALGSDFGDDGGDSSEFLAAMNGGNDDQLTGPTPEQIQQQTQEQLAAQQQAPAQQPAAQAGGLNLPPEILQMLHEHGQMKAMLQQGQAPQQQPQQAQADPDDLVTHGTLTQIQQQMQGQYRQALDQQRLQMSVQMVSTQFPDYQQVVAKLNDPNIHQFINFAAIQQAPNPALAAYQIAKAFATPAEIQAQATQEAAKLAPQATPVTPQSPKTLNTLPAAGAPQGANAAKVVQLSDLSPRQQAKLPEEQRRALYLKQLQGG